MKRIDLDQLALREAVEAAREERVVVTRDGKPVALIVALDEVAVPEMALDDGALAVVEERGREPRVPLADVEKMWKARRR